MLLQQTRQSLWAPFSLDGLLSLSLSRVCNTLTDILFLSRLLKERRVYTLLFFARLMYTSFTAKANDFDYSGLTWSNLYKRDICMMIVEREKFSMLVARETRSLCVCLCVWQYYKVL